MWRESERKLRADGPATHAVTSLDAETHPLEFDAKQFEGLFQTETQTDFMQQDGLLILIRRPASGSCSISA